MNKHNPKRVAAAALLAGLVLAGVVINQRADVGGGEASVLAEIPSSLETSPSESEVLRSYSVSGMCCASCTRKLHGEILGVEGVVECAVDLPTERVLLIAEKGVAPELILSTLNFDKYTAVELPSGT